MAQADPKSEREQLEQAIAVQESLRGQIPDAILDATISTLQEKLVALESHLEQQRKLATILFMDVAGYTAMTRHLDPEELMVVIDPSIARLAKKINVFGGHVARYQGDGFKAVFGLPVAQENDPQRAVQAGLAIQAEAVDLATELETRYKLPGFKVRVGITTGLVFAGGGTEGEDSIQGPTVNLAARLESAAEPGTVLISYDTYKHIRGLFDFKLLDPIHAKGFDEPVQVYQVVQAKPRAFYRSMRTVEGIETRLIGRDAELRILQDAYYTVVEDGEQQTITLIGEAGMGKSRLIYEFENWVDLRPESSLLYRGRAYLETRQLPYDLLRSIFAFQFGIEDEDPAETVREKWVAGFHEASDTFPGAEDQLSPASNLDLEMQAHILGQLMGYDFSDSPHVKPVLKDPQQIRDRALAYLQDYFEMVTRYTAVILLLEDLHWADDSSLDAFSRLGLDMQGIPILIVAAARPGLYERRPYWFEGRAFHQRVDLKPLSKRFNRQLIAEVLQNVPDIPESLSDLIWSNAEGNPFYVEELVKVLVDEGVIVKIEPNWLVDELKLKEIDVPATLTGILQARLEHLPKAERNLIQQASVVGRVFWDQAVFYLNQQSDDGLESTEIQQGLANIHGKEMVYRRELSVITDASEYIFKNAMLREVTYESVLKRLRRVYHALTAEWLMQQRGERTGEVVGLIADHLERAGESTEALPNLMMAAKSAADKFANEEAIDYYSRALKLVSPSDRSMQFEVLVERYKILDIIGDRKAQKSDLDRLASIAVDLDEPDNRAKVALLTAKYYFDIGKYEDARASAQTVVDGFSKPEPKSDQSLQLYIEANLIIGNAYRMIGNPDAAEPVLNSGLETARAIHFHQGEVRALNLLSILRQNQGDFSAAQDFLLKAQDVARHVDDPRAEWSIINNLGIIARRQGQYQSAGDYYHQALAISQRIGDRLGENTAQTNLGGVFISLGDYSQAKLHLSKALTLCEAIQDRSGEGVVRSNLGEVYFFLGDYDQAQTHYQAALEIFRETGFQRAEGIVLGNLSQLPLLVNRERGTVSFAESSQKIARELGDRYTEGLCSNLLGEAYLRMGKLEESARHFAVGEQIWTELDDMSQLLISQLGLAKVDAIEAPTLLSSRLEPILEILLMREQKPFHAEIRMQVYLWSYQLLEGLSDPRASDVLSVAHAELLRRATLISDPIDRQAFLNNNPSHKEIGRLGSQNE